VFVLKLMVRAIGYGILGAAVTPILTFFGVLALSYLLDPHCGTPGDSGGCEMGAGVIGFASILPGFLIGAVLGVYQSRRNKGEWSAPDDPASTDRN
jgi:hypothetical protein